MEKKKFLLLLLASVLFFSGCLSTPSPLREEVKIVTEDSKFDWQLPIQLKDSRYQVYETLGIPNDISSYEPALKYFLEFGLTEEDLNWGDESKTIEYFYDHGLALVFIDDVVTSILMQQLSAEYYSEYSGNIINDLLLTDSKNEIIRKLGTPSSMKTDPLPGTGNNDEPNAYASLSYYIWSIGDFEIAIDVTNEKMGLSDIRTLDKGKISMMRLYTVEPESSIR